MTNQEKFLGFKTSYYAKIKGMEWEDDVQDALIEMLPASLCGKDTKTSRRVGGKSEKFAIGYLPSEVGCPRYFILTVNFIEDCFCLSYGYADNNRAKKVFFDPARIEAIAKQLFSEVSGD